MVDTKSFDRRIGAKLQRVIDAPDEDNVRHARHRRWIHCARKDKAGKASKSGRPQIFVATTITFDPDRKQPKGARQGSEHAELRKFLDKSDQSIRRDYRSLFVPSRFGRGYVRTLLKKEDVAAVARIPGVRSVGTSDPVHAIRSVPADSETRNEFVGEVPEIPAELAAAIGDQKVLLGVIDIDGFDITHPAFLDANGKTLFAAIWDQNTSTPKDRPPSPKRQRSGRAWAKFDYGHEFDRRYIDKSLSRSGRFAYWRAGLPTTIFGSHGTHVTSIAAGNVGICRNAVLAAVVFARDPSTNPETTRDMNRGDGERLHDAVSYLREMAAELDLPVVINISLGRNCGAHDGSSLFSREIDSQFSGAGCCVVVAGGNAGDSSPDSDVEGRIHVNGTVLSGTPTTLDWRVTDDNPTENEMEIWYEDRGRLDVSVIAPSGERFGPVAIDDSRHMTLPGDGSRLFIQHMSYDDSNGCSYVFIQLSPPPAEGAVVASGLWKVELSIARDSTAACDFQAWIERNDGSDGLQKKLQSYFESPLPKEFDNTKVNSLACGQNVIAVANWDVENKQIHPTSNQGPTRDGRGKPDVAAPGTKIWGANGFPFQIGDDVDFNELNLAARRYHRMTGTSMAAPYVAGTAALMLSLNPYLTAPQIRAIVTRTAQSAEQGWQKESGYGLIDFEACLTEAWRMR